MESYQRIARTIVSAAKDRLEALVAETVRFENKTYSSQGSRTLLAFARSAAEQIGALLDEEIKIINEGLLFPNEIDARLQRLIQFIPWLHLLLGFIDGSDIHHSPGQLIQPLRRYVRSVIDNSEILVSAKPELNYSIQELATTIRSLSELIPELAGAASQLPEHLFIITIPSVESNDILIHGVVAHELGHALYNKAGLGPILLQEVTLREDLIKDLVPVVSTYQHADSRKSEDVIRRQLTEMVTKRVTRWIMELGADAIGTYLFGPALFFSAIQVLTTLDHIDQCSETHPPLKLRVKIMSRILKQNYAVENWPAALRQLISDWDEVSEIPIMLGALVDSITIESINMDVNLDLIKNKSHDVLTAELKYDSDKFDSDVNEIVPPLLGLVPCGESGTLGNARSVALPSIINAGWYIYLCRFDEFRSGLYKVDAESRSLSKHKLHELILKSLEISEMRLAWREMKG